MDVRILYQNASSTIFLLDIPRSIEAVQTICPRPIGPIARRLLSSKPQAHPYPSVEPKSAKAKAKFSPPTLSELLLQKHLEIALEEVKAEYVGKWCLPRIAEKKKWPSEELVPRKKLKMDEEGSIGNSTPDDIKSSDTSAGPLEILKLDGLLYINPSPNPVSIHDREEQTPIYIPPYATFVHGRISATVDMFKASAPFFDLVVLDPPWPNRSARRKKNYNISYGNHDILTLLSSIPISDHLKDDGVVAVWITNKDAFREMMLGPGGLFEEWGVTLMEEWIWIKTTVDGEPIFGLDSAWRKPYEVLLVGRRGADGGWTEDGVIKRILIGVPDLHSRKPNLKGLFERVLRKDVYLDIIRDETGKMAGKGYEGLEIFARNLTAGWWSWGNEVLKFQHEEWWVEEQLEQ